MPSPVGALTKIKKMHSPLEKAVAAHKLESMPSAQWAAYIKANAPKSAKKEALAVKLDELLARQPKVTKAEIVQHIKDNSPKIKTKILPNDPYFAGDIDSHMNIESDGMGGYNYLDADGQVEYNARNAHDMAGYLNSTEGAKYSEHTLPGGQNYQEMLLSLPRNPSKAMIRLQKVYEIKDANGQLLASGQLPMSPRTLQKVNNNPDWVVREFEQPNPNDLRRDPANFQSGHYDDPNILAHVRMNDRPTAEGKKALFLEELQSDWAQQGRKEGFAEIPNIQKIKVLDIPDVDYSDLPTGRWNNEFGYVSVPIKAEGYPSRLFLVNFNRNRFNLLDDDRNLIGKYKSLEEAKNAISNLDVYTHKAKHGDTYSYSKDKLNSFLNKETGIPRAPYVEDTGDWTALGLKKAIEHAVEQGHDSIAWTTGAQQADRYSLSKQIDRIDHNLNDDGTYSFSAIKDGKEVVAKEGLTQDELADHLGKDVAEKIVKGEGTAPASVDRWEAEPSIYGEAEAPPPYRSLSGLDLEVGGEGMKGYYDQIVPQTANDILKSMGVTERVKPIPMYRGQVTKGWHGDFAEGRPTHGYLQDKTTGQMLAEQVPRDELDNLANYYHNQHPNLPGDAPNTINTHQLGFDITPEIRDYVLNQGLPACAGGGVVKAVGKGLRGMAEKYRLAHEAAQKNAVKLLGLPPDNTAMDRAKAMGYDTKVYRGTGSDERVARKSRGHEHGIEGISTTIDPRYASMHGNNVMPLLAKSGNVEDYFDLINNFENKTGQSFSDASERLFTDAVKGEGVRASVLHDPNAGLDIRYLYPEDLRSVNAAFDPAHAKSPDLLKARGGAVHMAHGGEVDYDELYEFKDYGNRETGDAKDTGALGEIRMPNGRDVMTEYSINVDGREMPSIVEGMHPADVNYIRETGSVPQDAVATAVRSANKREASGQSPFWNRKDQPAFAHGGEVDYDAMYEFR